MVVTNASAPVFNAIFFEKLRDRRRMDSRKKFKKSKKNIRQFGRSSFFKAFFFLSVYFNLS